MEDRHKIINFTIHAFGDEIEVTTSGNSIGECIYNMTVEVIYDNFSREYSPIEYLKPSVKISIYNKIAEEYNKPLDFFVI